MIFNAPIFDLYDEELEQYLYAWACTGVKVIATSVPGSPIHNGHISCIQACTNFAPMTNRAVIVIVNGDKFLERKHGKAFQPLEVRAGIISAIKGVDLVVTFDHDSDDTVNIPLEVIKPNYFIKGGDRTGKENIPEWDTCVRNGIKIEVGQGDPKLWSSSDFLSDWVKFKNIEVWTKFPIGPVNYTDFRDSTPMGTGIIIDMTKFTPMGTGVYPIVAQDGHI